jgi:hypothetical protein
VLQRRFQSVPDSFHYVGNDKAKHQQIGNAVPYLLGVEVAANVYKAATGVDGNRPPALVGPSPAGWGLSALDLPRYQSWWGATGWRGVVLESRAALAEQLEEDLPADVLSQVAATAAAAAGAGGGGSGVGGEASGIRRGSGGDSSSQQQQQSGRRGSKSRKRSRQQQPQAGSGQQQEGLQAEPEESVQQQQ